MPAEQVLDDGDPALGRQFRVGERHPKLVGRLERARESEQLVLDVGEPALGAGDFEHGVRVRLDAGHSRHGQLLPTWLM